MKTEHAIIFGLVGAALLYGFGLQLPSTCPPTDGQLALQVLELQGKLAEQAKELHELRGKLAAAQQTGGAGVPRVTPRPPDGNEVALYTPAGIDAAHASLALANGPVSTPPPPPPPPPSRAEPAPPPLVLEPAPMSPVTGFAGTDGKIDPTNTATSCPEEVTEPANKITFLYQNPRTASLFMSGRLQKYGSGKFMYSAMRTKEMKPRPTQDLSSWLLQACTNNPDYKVVVYDSGASPNWWLSNWPQNTALVMTGDEMGRWGLRDAKNKRYFGPFGDGDRTNESFFYKNDSSPHEHILLPPTIRPWFRQYFDPKQQEAFGDGSALYIPLGSRVEFPDIAPEQITPAASRKLIYCLMAAMTDDSRRRLFSTLRETALIPAERGHIHDAGQWHPEITNAAYEQMGTYATTMLNSTFAPCPKGRNLDTYRMYEAIEAGAIPVIELKSTAHGKADFLAREHLPAEYFDSGMLFVQSWEDAPQAMMDLYADTAALNARQLQLMTWYKRYMTKVALSLERMVVSRRRACFAPGARGVVEGC